MHRLIFTFNLLVLYCLWYLDNLFRKTSQVKLQTPNPVYGKNVIPVGDTKGQQYMRFSNVTFIGRPRKILYSTYIYEHIDPNKDNFILRPIGEEPKFGYPESVKTGIFCTNKKDYTKLWLESLASIQEE
ncbi:uncharacterized protein LOC123313903 [Coccinella septempunctata]|uniref:uncharacterized protein LOC123313903 n=1 Tax=Coccinella septempunctata TaxID=41139 RepID=UPI001D05CDE6|nr:uncharacterized protein LOC123313903 [Coccinella septempunctata]